MSKQMLIDAQHQDETRVVILDNDTIEDFDFVTTSKAQVKGNIYLAKITRVEPSLQAAFVEYGGNKQGFLPFSEIHPDYYQIPTEDRKRLIEEELEEAVREEEAEEAEIAQQEKQAEVQKDRNGKGGKQRNRRGGRRRRGGRETETETETETSEAAQDGEETRYQAAQSERQAVASSPVEAGGGEEPEAGEAGEMGEMGEAEANPGEPEVETVSADVSEEAPRRRSSAFKRYRIQEVIKRGQIVLVQVIKEERGNKGCSLTTYVSLAGRYCVLMPNSAKAGGVSRKISNGEQRRKLKTILSELREKRGLSAIIRTAGIDRTKAEIKRDYEYLVKLWSQIRDDTLASTAPSLIYEESDIIKRSIRDLYTSDIEQVLVQGEDAYKDCKTFMKLIMPSHAPRVKQYKEAMPIFAAWGVEEQLASMYEPTVKMPSGGYVVIQQTEALTAIDVNSGRSTTERNVEETAIKTNLEAAKEVARQLRLRDLAGLIVVDFIDMYYGRNRRTLERAMKDALKHDRAKIQISRISPFGLIELSRQRMRPSIAESSTRLCPTCEGTGFIKSVETVAIQVIRTLEREAVSEDYVTLKVLSTPDVALHLLNDKRHLIRKIEAEYDLSISVEIGNEIAAGHFQLFKITEDGKEILHREQDDERGRKRKSRGRRGGKARRRNEDDEMDTDNSGDGSAEAVSEEKDDSDAGEGRQRRRRSASRRKPGAKAAKAEESSESYESSDSPEGRAASDSAAGSEPDVNAMDDEVTTASGTEDASKKPRRRASTRRRSQARKAPQAESKPEPEPEPETGGDEDTVSAEAPPPPAGQNVLPLDTASQLREESRESAQHAAGSGSGGASAQPELIGAQAQDQAADGTGVKRPKRKGWWNRVVQGAE